MSESDRGSPAFPAANVAAVEDVASMLRTTVGPISNDVLVINGLATRQERTHVGDDVPVDDYVVTSDGGEILEELPLQHPIAPLLRRCAGEERPGDTEVEGEGVTDGVSSTIVLVASLLEEAEALLEQGFHPHEIQRGYERGVAVARETLGDLAREPDDFDDAEEALVAVARSAMTGNDVGGYADEWARLAVAAVRQVGLPRPERFAVRRIKRGSLADSKLVRGAVLDRSEPAHPDMPKSVRDATVLVLDGQDDGGLREPDVDESKYVATLDSPDDASSFRTAALSRKRRIVEKLLEHEVDVVVARQGIDGDYQRLLADHGILGVRGVTQLDLQQVALATGSRTVLKTDDFEAADLGYAETVDVEYIDQRKARRKDRRMIVFDDCRDPGSVAVLLRGVQDQVDDQATRQVRKGAWAVATATGEGSARSGMVPGAGATEMAVARDVRERAPTIDDRSQLALEAYASAVERVVAPMVENAGGDPLSVVPDLRRAHASGASTTGYLLPGATLDDAVAAGVLDPLDTRANVYETATSVANLVLNVDDAIDATFTGETASPGESIYPEAAERQMDHLENAG